LSSGRASAARALVHPQRDLVVVEQTPFASGGTTFLDLAPGTSRMIV
jgi:hypothetical protein